MYLSGQLLIYWPYRASFKYIFNSVIAAKIETSISFLSLCDNKFENCFTLVNLTTYSYTGRKC